MGRRMQPRNEKFFTRFSKAGSNVVESAAMLSGRPRPSTAAWIFVLSPPRDLPRA